MSELAQLQKHRREELVARLTSPESGDFEGLVIQVGVESVVVEFPRSAAPTLPLAQLFHVAFTGAGLELPVEVPATIVRRDENPLSRSYRLALDPAAGVELHRAFLGRRVPRVRPEQSFAVEIRSPVGDDTFRGRVHDISSAGVSIVVDSADEQNLYRLGAVRLCFSLPGDQDSLVFTGMIRHRRFEDGEIRYGIEFYRDRSADFDANILRVGHWVDEQGPSDAPDAGADPISRRAS